MLDSITPVILTFNEAPNIGRTLERLNWAKDVVVVDSFSSDETIAIVSQFTNVRVFKRKFESHADQWNFGAHQTSIKTEWVLALDADYLVSDSLVKEIGALAPSTDVVGYRASFRYCIEGRELRGAAYPPVTVLWRRARGTYTQDGHTQRVQLIGQTRNLQGVIQHDDRKSIQHWLNAQSRYMRLEADKLTSLRFAQASVKNRVRKLIVIAPVAMFLYCMFVKGNILDGRAGLYYALQRSIAEAILSLYLLQATIGRNRSRG